MDYPAQVGKSTNLHIQDCRQGANLHIQDRRKHSPVVIIYPIFENFFLNMLR